MSDDLRGNRDRLLALDAFRGATIAAMLLVNNPGSWAHVYAPLRHASWHGWTPTDLIFPFFLFVVGVTTHLSIERRLDAGVSTSEIGRKVARRGVTIVLLGLVLNAFPFMALGVLPDIETPAFVDRVARQLETLRIPGVLQRIGVVYVLLGAWVLARSRLARREIRSRLDEALIVVILGGYWILLTLVRVPESGVRGSAVLDVPGETLAAWSDRLVFGTAHLWQQSKSWDPEGALSTLPAVATALLGLVIGRRVVSDRSVVERVKELTIVGSGLTLAGLAWGRVFPINKNLWTSSYAVFTAGAAALGLALCLWMIELRGWRRAAAPALAFGVNPLLAFFGSGIMARLLVSVVHVEIESRSVPLQRVIYETIWTSWLPDKPASLAYAVTFVLVWLAIVWPMWKRGWVWKV